MEQGFKIAIWMLCLIGYLQAKPVTTPVTTPVPWSEVKPADLGIPFLQDLKCGNENFTSPTNVKVLCRHAAVQHFIGQLELAREKCIDGNRRINDALQTLEGEVLPQLQTNTSTCELETTEFQFKKFVNEIVVLVERLNSKAAGSGK